MTRPIRLPALATCAVLALAGCSLPALPQAAQPAAAVELAGNVPQGAKDVPVDRRVEVTAEHGAISSGALRTVDGKTSLRGRVTEDGRWRADELLEPGTAYRLAVRATGKDGAARTLVRTFRTQALTLDEQTYPAVAPLAGETVGVGMPVIVTFDLPVKDRRLFEQNMHVRTDRDGEVEGSWSWFSDRTVHYRPRAYWPAGTTVTVDLRLNSLPAGGGIHGQQDQLVTFEVGRKVISTVDVAKHRMTVEIDDEVARTIPVSTGKAGHRTRRGTKVVMEKFSSVDMDAATTGVDSEDPEYYDLSDVRWAMRVTNSGEFLHAAPWSAGAQGRDNVSHGCTGMSTADARWLFQRSKRGDVVRYVNSERALEDRNGWTDWNVDWDTWTRGSALA